MITRGISEVWCAPPCATISLKHRNGERGSVANCDRDNTYCTHKETLTQKVWHSCASRADPFAKPSDKVCFCLAKYAEFSK
jgi:hypothetical protein